MGKNQSASGLTNVIQYSNGNITFVSGSTTLMSISSSGAITTTGVISGSNALSASYAANADTLDGLDSTVFTLTSSFNAQTASFTAFTASILAQTASLNAFSASILSFTASQNITNGTFTLTSSFNAQTASFTAFTASILATTASLNSFSASVLAQTASLNSFSSSVLTFTGSAATRLGALEAATSSLYSYTSSLNNKTSSFATTGSNTFIGGQTISGSILQSGSFTSTGTLTAQTLVVQTITSSVVYSSGSNIFGNTIGNTQTFTGSVLVTGSLTISTGGNVSAPTIFGSTIACSPIGCFATSCATVALFTGCVGIGGTLNPSNPLHIYTNSNTTSSAIKIQNATACISGSVGIEFQLLTDFCDYKKAEIRAVASEQYANSIDLAFWSGGSTAAKHAERLRITSDGVACFSSAVCVGGTLTLGTAGVTNAVINSADGMYLNIDSDGSGSTPEFMFGKGRSGAGSGGTTFMTIANSGCIGIGTTSPSAQLQICSSDGQLKLSGDGRAQMVLGTSVRSWQFETSCGVGNVPGCGIGLVEAGYGTRFQISPGGVACFSSTVCVPMLLASGCVNIGTTSAYTSRLNVQSSSPSVAAIKAGYGEVSGNGYTILADNYTLTESLIAIGVDYSSGGLVLGSIMAPSTTNQGCFISTQAQFGGYGSAIRLNTSGEIYFYNGTQNSVISTGNAKAASIALTIANTGAATFSSTITGTTIYGSTAVCSPNFQTGANSNLSKSSIRLRSANDNKYLDFNSFNTCNVINSNYGDSDIPLILGTYFGHQVNQLFLATNCNVGIRTNNPSYPLDVSGATRVGSLLVSNTTTTTWCVGRIDDARANTWYTIYTWPSIYDGAFTLAQLGYEDNNGDGANVHAFWMTTGAAYSTGFSTTQIGGATNLCLQRSCQSLQALITGVTDRTSGAYLGYTLQTMIVAS